ncbi:conserved hypothetical protein [Uncinocarpus reesii 1704]|uniref:Cell morphogenesis protein Las1 n=1 Tax=Uncinocarpus reesii (strain UAMH 1704) TaxID=336963 RepID=C4JRC1_UNCRE|nr:uncharacterized protein UREG_05010 [Uncinocarpus reesii 1704]EEP80168.1 conserved hypothetical protein [Uncinocarpus reesii 1704]
MPQLQFTPWKERSQLVAVRDQFYPPLDYNGPDMRPQASALVWVWKIRGNLPHAVEATALLTDAILHDDASKNSIFSIRATYSSAFCRFVTGLVDSKLHGRKQTMYQKAMTLGVPASFVELRHEATHRELPSLAVLRDAARRSLDWLWEFYWAKIDYGGSAPLGSSETTERALSDIISATLQSLLAKRSGQDGGGKDQSSRLSVRELAMICERESDGSGLVARGLLQSGVLIPQDRSFGDSMDRAFSTWDEHIKQICRHHTPFLTQFVENMVDVLIHSPSSDADNQPYQEGVYAWLQHILQSSSWALLRRELLVLSYAQADCRDGDGHWRRQLNSLMESYQDGLEATLEMKGMAPRAAEIESELASDIEGLQDYGWSMERRRTFKPIGLV